jgi:hypothetical protein
MRYMYLIGVAIIAMLVLSTLVHANVPAPQSIVIVACKVDDLTGRPGRQDPGFAAKDWRDLELHINQNQEYECKREVLHLEDGSLYGENAPEDMIKLDADFADWMQCARVGMMQAADWNRKNKGWAVVAVGCPTRIVNDKGATVGWQMPSCPTYLPGTNNRMRCNFDESVI